jgi:hypothetical protein
MWELLLRNLGGDGGKVLHIGRHEAFGISLSVLAAFA